MVKAKCRRQFAVENKSFDTVSRRPTTSVKVNLMAFLNDGKRAKVIKVQRKHVFTCNNTIRVRSGSAVTDRISEGRLRGVTEGKRQTTF
jgi:hypothetical protein